MPRGRRGIVLNNKIIPDYQWNIKEKLTEVEFEVYVFWPARERTE
jgi:hypothetical protein